MRFLRILDLAGIFAWLVRHVSGAVAALNDGDSFVQSNIDKARRSRDILCDALIATNRVETLKPDGALYAFLKIDPAWNDPAATMQSLSWKLTEYLITNGRIGSVPGVDFGANGEGYVRFCFARERRELIGALDSMLALFSPSAARLR